jgi:hypothetical protein
MAAHCTACAWTGGPTRVRDGGRCPECGEPVHYDRAPVTEKPRITDPREFNRRAVAALGRVDFGKFNSSERVYMEFKRQLAAGSVSERMQQAIINIAHRHRRQISDAAVNEYALMHARGAD